MLAGISSLRTRLQDGAELLERQGKWGKRAGAPVPSPVPPAGPWGDPGLTLACCEMGRPSSQKRRLLGGGVRGQGPTALLG